MDATYVSSSSFTVSGDRTNEFIADRRVKLDCLADGIQYATVVSSSFSSPDTTVIIDENTLTGNLVSVLYGIVQAGSESSLPEHAHDGSEGSGGSVAHSTLSNIDYVSSGHTGFAPTSHDHIESNITDLDKYTQAEVDALTWTESDITDLDKYTQAEVDTISGSLQTDIDTKADSSHGHTSSDVSDWNEAVDDRVNDLLVEGDNISLIYDDGANTLTISGSAGGGATNHALLSNLDYASSGHTGFSTTSHNHTESDITDLDKYTQSEVDTVSGSLSAEIDSDISTHSSSSDHDDRYYTETEVDTISGSLSNEIDSDIITFSGTIDHNTILNTHNLTTDIDHDQLTNYTSDEHFTEASIDKYTQAEVDALITTVSGKLDDHDELNNLDYASSGHTGFQPAGDYTTSAELATTSGTLQSQIDTKSNTGHDHDSSYYTETELDAGQLDNRYYTESEVDTISGTLQTDIDGKSDTGHVHTESDITNLDKYTQAEVDTISGSLSAEIDSDISTHTSDTNAHHNESHTITSHSDITDATGANIEELTGAGETALHIHDDRYYTESELDSLVYTIDFDAQTGSFTPSNSIAQYPSGATATIVSVQDDGDTGILNLADITGTFQDNEIIYESALGAELVTGTNSDMSGANNWIGPNLGTFDINTTVASKLYMLGDGGHDFTQLPTFGATPNYFYYTSFKARLNAGASTTIRAGFHLSIDGAYFEFTPTGVEDTYTGYVSAASTSLEIGLFSPGFNGIAFEIDDVSIKQVTNAALANGVVQTESLSDIIDELINHASSDNIHFTEASIDKYTQAEIDTISGTLSAEIDSDISTHSASGDHDDRYYTETEVDALTWIESDITDLDKYTQAEVDALITTVSGKLDDHDELNNLDYASSGHTGFQPAGDYATSTELATTSGVLSSEIDSDISTHASSADHDGRYYTESEVDTISGSLSAEIDSDISTHSASGDHDGRYYTEIELDSLVYALNFDAQTGSFTVGNTITGADSEATATIDYIIDDGTTGTLYLSTISGTFQDDEIIYESALGSPEVDDDCANDDTGDYTVIDCTLGFDTDHYEVVYVASTQHTIHNTALTVGIYAKMTADVKDGTIAGVSGALKLGGNDGSMLSQTTFTTTGTWQTITHYSSKTTSSRKYLGIASSMIGAGNFEIRNIKAEPVTNAALANGAVQTESLSDVIDELINHAGSAGGGASTLLELTDTPAAYDDGKYLKSTPAGTEWATVSGGGGGTINPSSDNRMARYDGTDAIQGTGITIDDSDNITGVNSYSIGTYNALSFPQTNPTNIAIGPLAGSSLSPAPGSDIFIGYQSGYSMTGGSNNVFMGYDSAYFNQTGAKNVVIGTEAGYGASGNSYSNNTFLGHQSGFSVTTGGSNVSIGYGAGYSSTSAANNVIIGYYAARYNETGYDNVIVGREAGHGASSQNYIHSTFLGYRAGYSVTTGSYNLYGGSQAGYFNQTGQYNVVLGGSAGYGTSGQSYSNNTFVGSSAANANTTGGNSVAVGYQAAYYNQTGASNVIMGYQAGYGASAQSYSDNVFLGYQSGFSVTTGGDNVFLGHKAGYSNTSAYYNFYGGFESAYYNQVGTSNVVIGYQAGFGATGNNFSSDVLIGYRSGYSITTGSDNVFMGYQSAYYNKTGTNNVVIGRRAGFGSSGNSYSDNVFIGYHSGYTANTGGNNVCIGYEAGHEITTGTLNVIIGSSAAYYMTNPASNVAIGYYAMRYNVTGAGNTCVGDEAGHGVTANSFGSGTFLGYRAGFSMTTGSANTFLGYIAGFSNADGHSNVAIGYSALYWNEAGDYNICIGREAGRGVTGNSNFNNIYIGRQAGYSVLTGGDNNVCIGYQAAYAGTTNIDSVCIGHSASYFNQTGDYNIVIGKEAGKGVTGNSYAQNVFIGYRAGYVNTTGQENVIIGYAAGFDNNTGLQNVFMGASAGSNNTSGDSNVYLGYQAGYNTQAGNYNVAIGREAGKGVASNSYSNNTFVGYYSAYTITTASQLVVIGYNAGKAITSGGNNTFIGSECAYSFESGMSNTVVGQKAFYYNISGNYNTVMGRDAGRGASAQNYSNNTFVGYQSGYSATTGNNTVAMGFSAGYSNETGHYNVAMGSSAGYSNEAGHYNVVIGYQAGKGVTGNSYASNIFIGYRAGYVITTGGSNIAIGHQSGYTNATGAGNVFIGYRAGYNETGSNKLYIENSNSATPLIYGEFDNNFLRVNGDFDVTGNLTVSGTSPGGGGGTINPSSDNRMARYDGTDAIQGTGITIDDSDSITGVNSYSIETDNALRFPVDNTNLAIGPTAGNALTTGAFTNIAVGKEAMLYNETGDNNTVIGYQAGRGVTGNSYLTNIFIGSTAGYSATTGGYNVFVGYGSGYFNNTGQRNVYLGAQTGNYNQTGADNVLIGHNAGNGVTGNSFSSNIFLGYRTGFYIKTGGKNVFLGHAAGYFNEVGASNVVIGHEAGLGASEQSYMRNVFIGYRSGYANTTGNYNVFMGYQAGNTNTDGTYNTVIGHDADVASSSLTNAMALGNGASVDASNKIVLGNSSATTVGGYDTWTDYSSDRSVKFNIEDNYVGLDFILGLRPRKFEKIANPGTVHDGLVAQEVKEVMDELGVDFSGWVDAPNDEGTQALKYPTFVVPLINAIKELKAEIDELKNIN